MRANVPQETASDLLFTAEQLHHDLLQADLLIPAALVNEAVTDLRQVVREQPRARETGE